MRRLVVMGTLAALGSSARAEEVDLLHAAPSVVAVSSVVKNAINKPEHLVDGDPETAWNSRTGDLVGAWIAFRVPAEAKLSSIQLTVGYTMRGNEGDYFTMNQRVRKVRVVREGKSLGEFTLDIEKRELQSIPIAAAGGEYKIEVTELVAGSKAKWREVCVSELRVVGTIANPSKGTPVVRVGHLGVVETKPVETKPVETKPRPEPTLPPPPADAPARPLSGPYRSLPAFCKEYLAQHTHECTPTGDPDDTSCVDTPGPPECDPDNPGADDGPSEIEKPVAPYRAIEMFHTRADSIYGSPHCNLAIRTKAGWYIAADWIECGGAEGAIELLSVRIDELALRDLVPGGSLELALRFTATPQGEAGVPHSVACAIDAKGIPYCTRPIPGAGQVMPKLP